MAASTIFTTIGAGEYSFLPVGYSPIPLSIVSSVSGKPTTFAYPVQTLFGVSGPIGYLSSGKAYTGSPPAPTEESSSPPVSSVNPSNPTTAIASTGPITSQPTSILAGTTAPPASTTGVQATSAGAAGAQQTPGGPNTTHNDGLSGGAVGGIAVACVVGGALIAGLLVWFLMRRRTKHYRNIANQAGADGVWGQGSGHEKGMNSSISPIGGGPYTSFLSGILPVASDDKEIKQRVSGMLEAAAIHVDNFYDNVPVIASPEEQLALAKFNSVHLDGSVSDLMAIAKTPKTVITRALTETLVASISPEVAPSRCLLPAEFAALPRSLKGTGTGTTLGQNSSALFWWRHLSTHLSPPTQQNQTYLDTRTQTITMLIADFESAFKPWRKSKYTDKQETDALTGTFSYAAETGVWLFGQRSGFEFVWTDSVPNGEIETRPALIKTSDVNGQPLAKPRSVVQRHLERV